MSTEITSPATTIENIPLRGVTGKIILSIIISTTLIVSTVLGAYYTSLRKDDIQDLQLETMKLQEQNITIQLHDLQSQINTKKDKSDK